MADSEITPAPFVPVHRRLIVWDPTTGLPSLAAEPVLAKHHLQSLYFVAAAQPYVVEDPLDPDFGLYDGMTIAEVMVRKQLAAAAKTGDSSLVETVMDRLIGKPMARAENLTVSASYEDFLRGVEKKGEPKPIEGAVETDNPFGDLA